jgi:CIC family chloride channel protein
MRRLVKIVLLLAGLVGLVGGIGAVAFKWLVDRCIGGFWGELVGTIPATPGGEPTSLVARHPFMPWLVIVAPALGGLASGLIVYRLAPEAEGHGTETAATSARASPSSSSSPRR